MVGHCACLRVNNHSFPWPWTCALSVHADDKIIMHSKDAQHNKELHCIS